MWRASLLLLASLCAGCSGKSTADARHAMRRVELPGFSIELPDGKVVATSRTPFSGKHQVALPASQMEHWLADRVINGSAVVSWSSQAVSQEEWMAEFLPIYLKATEVSFPESRVLMEERLSEDRWFVVAGTNRVPLAVGSVRCDPAFQIEITYAAYHDASANAAGMRRILTSVRCQVTGANRTRPVATVHLPPTFTQEEVDDGQVYRSTDGEVLVLNFTQGNLTNADPALYRSVIRAVVSTTIEKELNDSQLTRVSGALRQPGPALLTRVDLPDADAILYVGSLWCPRVESTLMSIWIAPSASEKLAIERLGQVGCPES